MNAKFTVPMRDDEKSALVDYLAWSQSRESNMDNIPASGDNIKKMKARRQFQRVCFTCHALPYLSKTPWPNDPLKFVNSHLADKAPLIAAENQIIDIIEYMRSVKKEGF